MKGTINGKAVEFEPNETILSAARRHGHFIPTLCEMGEIDHAPATCRVCLVEIRRLGGGSANLATSCNTPMEEGLHVSTRTPSVREAQRLQVELVLADHNQDCAACVRHGDCELQDVAQFVGLQDSRYHFHEFFEGRTKDFSSPAIVRDMTKCVRCFRCVAVCRDIQCTDILTIAEDGIRTEVSVRESGDMAGSDCISCGQCTLVCPVGALAERDDAEEVIDFLYDPEVYTVFQFAPAVRVALGEEFGLRPGSVVTGQIITAMKALGADAVLDTNFAADLVVMEEGAELLHRVRDGGVLPLFTSCSPGWVNFVEKFYPEVLPHLSSCKSPQMCLGALAKTRLAEKAGVDPSRMRMVSVMPCTAKKEEAKRPEFTRDGRPDVDVVLTTREFARLLKREGIWLPDLCESHYDDPWMSGHTGAAILFGTTGGVTEAALRTVYHAVTGEELENVEIESVRGVEGVREASIRIGSLGEVKVAVAHGTKAARKVVEQAVRGESPYAFVEFMGCPGGCMGGGGQPRGKKSYRTSWHPRQQAIYGLDRGAAVRRSHENPMIQAIYNDFLGEPLGRKSHELLHTRYLDRKREVRHSIREIWDEINKR